MGGFSLAGKAGGISHVQLGGELSACGVSQAIHSWLWVFVTWCMLVV